MEKKIQVAQKISQRLLGENRVEEGIKYLELVAQLQSDVYGSCSDEVWLTIEQILQISNTLAMTLLEKGDHTNCVRFLRHAKQLSATQGWSAKANISRLRCRAITLNNLACFCRKKGKFQDALNYVKSAIDIEAQLDVSEVENPAGSVLNMCAILSQLGRHEEALASCKRAMAFLKSQPITPSNVSSTAIAYHNLGVEQEHLRMPKEVYIATYQEGVDYCEGRLAPNDPLLHALRQACSLSKGQQTSQRNGTHHQTTKTKTNTPQKPFKKPPPVQRAEPDENSEDEEVARINQSHIERSRAGTPVDLVSVDRTSSGFGQVHMDPDAPGHRSQTSMSRYDLDEDSDSGDDFLPPKLEELRRRIRSGFGINHAREWTPSLDPNRSSPSPNPSPKPAQPPSPPSRDSTRPRGFERASRVAPKSGTDLMEQLADEEVAQINPTSMESSVDEFCRVAILGDTSALRQYAETSRIDLTSPSSWGATALHAASATGHVATVRELLDRFPSLLSRVVASFPPTHDKARGSTALHWAAMSWRGSNASVVELLLSRGAVVDVCDDAGFTALHYACARGDYDAVKVLLSHGANQLAQSQVHAGHCLPIHIAAAAGRDALVREFLDSGCTVNLCTGAGQSLLELAARGGHKQVVDLLLRRGAPYTSFGDVFQDDSIEADDISDLIMGHFASGFSESEDVRLG
eukprot:TRINITY_DN2646_c0_g1_i1.p1 TRINITY_DN2646_c0_g1~~TRINITY_DN2646_c0_g1_i1.p1  ORF type:complete len:690 (+),score=138.16 TRINITY_DN2646_c0_g1_i1:91-2160(+)